LPLIDLHSAILSPHADQPARETAASTLQPHDILSRNSSFRRQLGRSIPKREF
jgi:hypothetical protein